MRSDNSYDDINHRTGERPRNHVMHSQVITEILKRFTMTTDTPTHLSGCKAHTNNDDDDDDDVEDDDDQEK